MARTKKAAATKEATPVSGTETHLNRRKQYVIASALNKKRPHDDLTAIRMQGKSHMSSIEHTVRYQLSHAHRLNTESRNVLHGTDILHFGHY